MNLLSLHGRYCKAMVRVELVYIVNMVAPATRVAISGSGQVATRFKRLGKEGAGIDLFRLFNNFL